MKGGLPIYIFTINIDFFVTEETNSIVNVTMRDCVEHYVSADLFDLADHFNNYELNLTV